MTIGIDIAPSANDDAAEHAVCAMPASFAPTPLPIVGRLHGASTASGVALAFAARCEDEESEDRFALDVLDAQGELLMRLGSLTEEEVVAVWRNCCRTSGLPRMIRREDGSVATVSPQLGCVALGTSRQRRRHGLLNGRRPRFLTRRKATRLPARPRIYRGENEIIARS